MEEGPVTNSTGNASTKSSEGVRTMQHTSINREGRLLQVILMTSRVGLQELREELVSALS